MRPAVPPQESPALAGPQLGACLAPLAVNSIGPAANPVQERALPPACWCFIKGIPQAGQDSGLPKPQKPRRSPPGLPPTGSPPALTGASSDSWGLLGWDVGTKPGEWTACGRGLAPGSPSKSSASGSFPSSHKLHLSEKQPGVLVELCTKVGERLGCAQHFTVMISLTVQGPTKKGASLCWSHFTDEETGAQSLDTHGLSLASDRAGTQP